MNEDLQAHPTNSGWTVIDRGVAALERAATITACGFLLLIGLLIIISTVGRTFFNQSFPDDVIVTGLVMVGVVVLPMAYVQAHRMHITITIISNRLPESVQRWLVLMGDILALLFFGVLGVSVAIALPEEFGFHYGGILDVPVWPMKAVYAFAMILFTGRLLLCVIADMGNCLRRDSNRS